MQPLNAVVKNGRLTLDVPSDLPDGQIVPLLPLQDLLEAADSFESSPPFPFEIVRTAPAFVTRPPVDAAALIDELRSM